jgi:hypothetical protein
VKPAKIALIGAHFCPSNTRVVGVARARVKLGRKNAVIANAS